MTQTVGKVYAEALFELAQEMHQEEKVWRELGQITDLVEQEKGFAKLLDVPTMSAEERVGVLQKVIGTEDGITENFLCLLCERRRFGHLSEIRSAFNKLYYDAFGIAEVAVTSAVPLTASLREALVKELEEKLGRRIRLQEQVDASLIGGLVVQYGDTRMDNSLRTRLEQFRRQA